MLMATNVSNALICTRTAPQLPGRVKLDIAAARPWQEFSKKVLKPPPQPGILCGPESALMP